MLFWTCVGLSIGGFVVLLLMKKSMDRKVAVLTDCPDNGDTDKNLSNPVVLWVCGSALWGVLSIFLVVWAISIYT